MHEVSCQITYIIISTGYHGSPETVTCLHITLDVCNACELLSFLFEFIMCKQLDLL